MENNRNTEFHFENCVFDFHGGILNVHENSNFVIKNNFLNLGKLSYGFQMKVNCNYPEAGLIGFGLVEGNVAV